MPKVFNEFEVDVNQYPERAQYDFEATEAISGALHADAAKFLYFLIRQGICEIEEKDYHRLIEIFSEPATHFTKRKKTEFDKLIQEKLKVINAKTYLRFMGAEIAGQGSNDYFILKLFEKISQNGVQFEAMLSNRSYEFVEAYERCIEREGFFHLSRLHPTLTESTENMLHCVREHIIHGSEFMTLFEKYYLPHLKLLSYSIDAKKYAITIYSNCEINLEIVERLADTFNVAFHAESFMDLAKTIEGINQSFTEYKKDKKMHSLCSEAELALGQAERLTLKANPVAFLLWNNRSFPEKLVCYDKFKIKFLHASHPNQGLNKSLSLSRSSSLGPMMQYYPQCYNDFVNTDVSLSGFMRKTLQRWRQFLPSCKPVQKLVEFDRRLETLTDKLDQFVEKDVDLASQVKAKL